MYKPLQQSLNTNIITETKTKNYERSQSYCKMKNPKELKLTSFDLNKVNRTNFYDFRATTYVGEKLLQNIWKENSKIKKALLYK